MDEQVWREEEREEGWRWTLLQVQAEPSWVAVEQPAHWLLADLSVVWLL